MPRVLALALAGALLSLGADAQTLRWASQGDPQTMDPHSQNESMTNMMNGQVYERLTSRDRQLKIYNYGRARNDKLDALAARSSVEPDPKKREQLVKAALREHKEQFTTLPLHRQVIPWAARANVNVVHRPDNWLEVAWVTIGK